MRSLAQRSHRQHAEPRLHERAQIAYYDAADAAAVADPPIANGEPAKHGHGHAATDDATRSSRSAADDDAAADDYELQLLAAALSINYLLQLCSSIREFSPKFQSKPYIYLKT